MEYGLIFGKTVRSRIMFRMARETLRASFPIPAVFPAPLRNNNLGLSSSFENPALYGNTMARNDGARSQAVLLLTSFFSKIWIVTKTEHKILFGL